MRTDGRAMKLSSCSDTGLVCSASHWDFLFSCFFLVVGTEETEPMREERPGRRLSGFMDSFSRPIGRPEERKDGR